MAAEITDLKLDGTLYDIKDDGAVRSVTVGTTTTGGPDSAAKVENSGTDVDIVLDFTIPQGPKGDTGETGKSATIAVGQVTTGRPGTEVMIVNAGDENHGIFDFTIPQGEKGDKGDQGEQGIQGETGAAATIEIGTVTTGAAGSEARVSNVGTATAAIFNFTIPKGDKGDQGNDGADGTGIESVEQTTTSTDSGGKNTVTVTLTDGTTSTFDVYNGARGATGDAGAQGEKGEKGDPGDPGMQGDPGESCTIEIGETTTGPAGSEAQVVNTGTASAAILNFTIPKGDQGEQGIQGEKGDIGDTGPQGEAAKINAGDVTLYSLEDYDEEYGEPDEGMYPAYVINTGTNTNATFDFYLPRAQAATIEVGEVITGEPGSDAIIKNVGDKTNAIFNFTIPAGKAHDFVIGYIDDSNTLYTSGETDDSFGYSQGLKTLYWPNDSSDYEYDEDEQSISFPDESENFYYVEDESSIYFLGPAQSVTDFQDAEYYIDMDTGLAVAFRDKSAHEEIDNLQVQINELSDTTDSNIDDLVEKIRAITEITVLADDWEDEGSYYGQTIAVDGMTEDNTFTVGILYPDDCDRDTQKAINKAAGFIYAIDSGDGIVTFKATDWPETDIPLGLRGVM